MAFLTPLIVEEIADRPEWWRLYYPLVYRTRWGMEIAVPKGFETDLASIPRQFRRYFVVNGSHRRAAVLHDYLYHHRIGTRASADALFREAMADTGVPAYERLPMWAAVRLGGWAAWRRTNNTNQGEHHAPPVDS